MKATLNLTLLKVGKGRPGEGKWVVELSNGGKDENDSMRLLSFFDSPKQVVKFFGNWALQVAHHYTAEQWNQGEEHEND